MSTTSIKCDSSPTRFERSSVPSSPIKKKKSGFVKRATFEPSPIILRKRKSSNGSLKSHESRESHKSHHSNKSITSSVSPLTLHSSVEKIAEITKIVEEDSTEKNGEILQITEEEKSQASTLGAQPQP